MPSFTLQLSNQKPKQAMETEGGAPVTVRELKGQLEVGCLGILQTRVNGLRVPDSYQIQDGDEVILT